MDRDFLGVGWKFPPQVDAERRHRAVAASSRRSRSRSS